MKHIHIICEAQVPNIHLLNSQDYEIYYDENKDVYSMERIQEERGAGIKLPEKVVKAEPPLSL